MKNKKMGIGLISLVLVIIAVFWAYEINGFWLSDDSILVTFDVPTWSNRVIISSCNRLFR